MESLKCRVLLLAPHGGSVDRLVDVDKDRDGRGIFSTFRQNFCRRFVDVDRQLSMACRRRQALVDVDKPSTRAFRRLKSVDNRLSTPKKCRQVLVDVDKTSSTAPRRRQLHVDVDKPATSACRCRQVPVDVDKWLSTSTSACRQLPVDVDTVDKSTAIVTGDVALKVKP